MNSCFTIYPEVVSGAIKNKEEDIFLLWLIAKDIDVNGKGIIELKDLIKSGKEMFGLKSNYIYSKINKGVDLYWRKPFGKHGNKLIGLISINNIAKRLQPKITKAHPILIPKHILKASTKDLRELLISIVVGRYSDLRPISFWSLIDNLGISESAIRNAVKNCIYINVITNYVIVAEDLKREKLSAQMQQTKEPWAHKIIQSENKYRLLRQNPNSYELLFKRMPMKKRPPQLKKNDKLMLDILEPRRYSYL